MNASLFSALRVSRGVLLAALVLLGCPNPDEGFVLSGTVVDQNGQTVRNHEVRVLRDVSVDGERCGPWEPFTTLTTDARGRFATTVYRYQQTLGQAAPRYFRVEATSVFEPTWTTAFHFRFPAVDVKLPNLLILTDMPVVSTPQGLTDSFTEVELDGAIAWRTATPGFVAEDRVMKARRVDRASFDNFVEANVLGVDSRWVSVEVRLERPTEDVPAVNPSRIRGKPCSVALSAGGPCPFTDGRMLPVKLVPGTKSVSITSEQSIFGTGVTVRGLQVDGAVSRVILERGDLGDEGLVWRPWVVLPRGKETIEWSRTHCREPGAFFDLTTGLTALLGVRIRAEDASGAALDLTSLAEVSVR
jgi:hypothetical protein